MSSYGMELPCPDEQDAHHAWQVQRLEYIRRQLDPSDVLAELQHLLLDIVDDDRHPLRGHCRLVIDHSGVGRPVFDLFTESGQLCIGITITGGAGWHKERWDQWHVAKMLLVSLVQKLLQSGRLRIGARLPFASTLQKELKIFRVKLSKAAHEVYEAREGSRDDLVLSLAIALFVAEHPGPYRFAPLDWSPEDATRTPAPRLTLPAAWVKKP